MALFEYLKENAPLIAFSVVALVVLFFVMGGSFSAVMPGGQFECNEAVAFDLDGDGEPETYNSITDLRTDFEEKNIDWVNFSQTYNPHIQDGIVVVGGESCE